MALLVVPTHRSLSDSSAAKPVRWRRKTKVTVFDDYANPEQQRELGTVTAAEKSKKFTYTMDLVGEAGKCQTWTNTATVEESASHDENNTDSADVEVCSKHRRSTHRGTC